MQDLQTKSKKPTIATTLGFFMCCFLIYSLIGFIYEVIWVWFLTGEINNRGFLYGFYLPIYGFGGLILYLSVRNFMKKKIRIGKLNITPVFTFLIILFIVSAIEYFASVVLELMFSARWWDYSHDVYNIFGKDIPLHINGRVSLRNSAILASGGMAFVYLVQPILNKTIGRLKPIVLKIAGLIVFLVMFTDLVVTLLGYII